MSMKATLFIVSSLLLLASVYSDGVLKLHGGAVMNFPISLHLFYYGPFASSDEEVQLTQHFGGNIGDTAWWKVTTCIEDPQGNPVASHVDVASTHIEQKIKKGSSFTSQAEVLAVLRSQIDESGIGEDPNDIYIIFLHDDIDAEFLCTDTNSACAYHGFYNNTRGNIKYAIIGGGGLIGMQCAPCKAPNGPWTPLTNQMVNSMANILIRTVSDPVPFTGWYDSDSQENGEKCAGQYLNAQNFRPDPSTQWNVALGHSTTHWFLIQGNWDISTNKCVLYPTQDCAKIAPSRPITSAPHNPSSASATKINLISIASLFSALFALIFAF